MLSLLPLINLTTLLFFHTLNEGVIYMCMKKNDYREFFVFPRNRAARPLSPEAICINNSGYCKNDLSFTRVSRCRVNLFTTQGF
jgi:hypothetical protein